VIINYLKIFLELEIFVSLTPNHSSALSSDKARFWQMDETALRAVCKAFKNRALSLDRAVGMIFRNPPAAALPPLFALHRRISKDHPYCGFFA
jgi:hypothetical protein